jgi:hypothetical protein
MDNIYSTLNNWFLRPINNNVQDEFAEILNPIIHQLNPTWHPLGFIHTKLAQGPMGDTFRMHVWSLDHNHKDEQIAKIHDHLFNVVSRIVFGDIENIVYEFEPDPNGNFRVLKVNYGPNESALIDTQIYGNVIQIRQECFSAPFEYNIPKFELHESKLKSYKTAYNKAR